MKAFRLNNGLPLERGYTVMIFKYRDDAKGWENTGERGKFEEVTRTGLINFNCNGKPRQCMPEGIGARVK